MKNFVQNGHALDFTAPSGGVTSGTPLKIGGFIVVPAADAAEGAVFAGHVEGVFDLVAEGAGSGQDWSVGDAIYWDDTAKQFTKTSTGNTVAGLAAAAKVTTDTTGRLRLICGAAL